MLRSVVIVGLACTLSLVGASVASAQDDGFVLGSTDVGPVIGVGNTGGAGLAFGGRFERGIKEIGSGVLGIGVGIDYYHWSEDFGVFGFSDFSYTYMPIGVTANYHFHLENRKIDPFLGAGIVYVRVSSSYSGTPIGNFGFAASATDFVGHAGIRYYYRPKMALYADAGGGGGSSVHIGLMFKLGD